MTAEHGETWAEVTTHRFVRELHADGVDDVVFRRYLLQDYAFVETLAVLVPAVESFVGWLRTELDREGAAASERRQARLGELFTRTVELEVTTDGQ